jgi:cytoskeletal protein CcmA (bactofilin family)
MPWGIFDRKPQSAAEWSGFLERGTKLEGRLDSPGTLRIDSEVKGTITSASTLIVGEDGRVDGELTGNVVIIEGRLDGTVRAHNKVALQPKAIVTGDIETPNLMIEPGAVFDGRCHVVTTKEPDKPIIIPIRSAASSNT